MIENWQDTSSRVKGDVRGNIESKSLLITADYPPIVSGISTVFYNIWKHLSQDRLLILAPRTKDCFEFDSKNRIRVLRRYFSLGDNVLRRMLRSILLYIYTKQIVKKENINLLVCGQPMIIGFIGLVFKKQFKIPYHVWVYGGEILKFKGNKILLGMLRVILNNADKIISNSSFTAQVFRDLNIDVAKIVIVSPAVDIEQFRPGIDISDLVREYDLEKKKTIMTVGRLVPRKGNDTIIKCLKRVIEKIPNVVYLIIGEGPNKQNLEVLVKELGLRENVIFAGYVSDEDLPKYYNLCDLYVLPNRETGDFDTIEGFGITFVEAGACGKPVIGGRSGGTSDSILDGVTGVLVEPQDEEMLVNRIIELLVNHELANRLGSQGRERVFEKFRWEVSSGIVENLMPEDETKNPD